MFQSIRFKIILLYMIISASTLSLFSLLLYRNFSDSLVRNMDSLLRLKAEGVVNSIETYWAAEKLERAGRASGIVLTKINNKNFIKIADRWMQDKSNDPEFTNIAVQIRDPDTNVIASSKDIPTPIPIPKDILGAALRGHRRFHNIEIRSIQGSVLSLRMLTTPVVEDRHVAYIVQVASSIAPIQNELNNLKTILFILIPFTVLLSGTFGLFLVKATLSPVDDMVRTIRQIKADNLKLRIKDPHTNDEIKRLADTFNEMLAGLEHSFTSQRQFVQDISHELKTPLTVLKGEFEVTLKKARTPAEYANVLKSSLEEIDKIRRIVDSLLILARFDTKEVSLERKSVDLSRLAEKVLDDLKVLADQRNIAIDFSSDEKLIWEVNEAQVKQLFVNLVDNAIKYTPPKGQVSLALRREHHAVVFEVSDTGVGIPENELAHIFDRFYRVDKSRSREGFGLGLSIAKSIVEAHHGEIRVKSQPDRGTSFIVTLPGAFSYGGPSAN